MSEVAVQVTSIKFRPQQQFEQALVLWYECGGSLHGYVAKVETLGFQESLPVLIAPSSMLLDLLRLKQSIAIRARAPDGQTFFGTLTIAHDHEPRSRGVRCMVFIEGLDTQEFSCDTIIPLT